MEPKTNHQLEKLRFSNFMTGFCLISGFVLAAFSYGDLEIKQEKVYKQSNTQDYVVMRDEIIEPPKSEPVQQQIQTKQQSPEIDLTNDINTTQNTNQSTDDKQIDVVVNIDNTITSGDGDGGNIVVISDPVIEFPDVEATFPGGELAMREWMAKNLQYPEISIENGDKGRVFLKFVVEKDGTISNVDIVKGATKELDQEAKRMIRSMPKWQAGESEGRKVRSTFTLPINFELY